MRLGVNIDHVATLRQARGGSEPDPVHAAMEAELGGADWIVCHLREDRRHLQDRDLRLLRETVHRPLNLEMAASEEIRAIALQVKPDRVTLVPERREERTTEGGLNAAGQKRLLRKFLDPIREKGIQVSLFIEPDERQIRAAEELDADLIELHTGAYALSGTERELKRLAAAARAGLRAGLEVAAGHGLNYHNVEAVAQIPEIVELNIGHSIVSRGIFVGLREAVRQMKVAVTARRQILVGK